MRLFDVYPINDIAIERALGSTVWDDKGTEYLDMYGGHAVISIGHTHPHYVRRITEQLSRYGFYSNSVRIPAQEELASLLGRVSGRDDYQLFLCNSGAEANENALKLASFLTGRSRVVAFRRGFHGRTSLAVAATDNPAIVAPVNRTENVTFLPFNDAQALEDCFRREGDRIAAVIIEGIQGVGGIHVADDEFLRRIRELCDRHGAVYVADAVQCGYGRSGRFFSHDYAGVDADIYSVAKGMGNGFPIGGILIAPHIQPRHSMLGTTFGGNPLACAAALAVLEVMESENLMQNAARMGGLLMDGIRGLGTMQNVRGRGLMIGFDPPAHMKDLRKNLLTKQHVFTGEAKPSVVRLLPSLALSEADALRFLQALRTEAEAFPTHPETTKP
ncbi:MAG: aspartate aminotransferase family protein [Chitinophagia bacterium]|nr:aspartate aminotransferase family protein [Chitinophagia bacterium]